jgi:hypothetical protein
VQYGFAITAEDVGEGKPQEVMAVGKNPYLSQLQLRVTGQLSIYAAPMSVVSHLQWSIESIITLASPWSWQPQPLIPKSQSCSLPFRTTIDNLPRLVSALYEFPNLYAEVVRDPINGGLGERWLITPNLGLRRLDINEFGDAVVDENQLRSAIAAGEQLLEKLSWLIGEPWERELEPLRISPVVENARLLAAGG